MKREIKNTSITKNTLYYLLYQMLNVVFPFFSSIYIARVLLPAATGTVTYAQNIASYFSILAFLGIPTYGMREISKARFDEELKSKVYSELFIINLISTVIFLIAYLILVFSVNRFRKDTILYLITGLTIAFNAINNEWLFSGLEKFSFISVRSGIVKVISFVLIIMFVKSPNDYKVYALISVLGSVGNYLVNIIYTHRYVKWTWLGLKLGRHLKPVFILTAVNLAIELYSLLDITMLGIIATEADVAFYSYGNKIVKIILQILNALTIVVVPRFAKLYDEKNYSAFNSLLRKVFLSITALSLPMFCGLIVIARDAVLFLFGEAFLPSANVLQILSPVIIISPIGYLLGSRVLLVSGKEDKMFYSVGIGTIVNIIGNCLLIPRYTYNGAALSSAISELVIFVTYIFFSRNLFVLKKILIDIMKIVSCSVVMTFLIIVLKRIYLSCFNLVLVQIISAVIIYFSFSVILNEEIINEYYIKAKNKLLKR